jgi:8-oxo-dGTP pyrophosphatase MutT (NUDIX family)
MVRQFRFGARDVTLEVPAGLVDKGEEPQHAAARELLEETGYVSEAWRDLGAIYQNPASHTNFCHLWLADDATPTGATSPDAGEHIQALVMSEAEVAAAVRDGRIRHPLTLAALSRVLDLRV